MLFAGLKKKNKISPKTLLKHFLFLAITTHYQTTMRRIKNRSHNRKTQQILRLQRCICELKKENTKNSKKLKEIRHFIDLNGPDDTTQVTIIEETLDKTNPE